MISFDVLSKRVIFPSLLYLIAASLSPLREACLIIKPLLLYAEYIIVDKTERELCVSSLIKILSLRAFVNFPKPGNKNRFSCGFS